NRGNWGARMIDGIETFYQQIAESMVEGIPEEWSSAKYEAIFYSGSSTYEAEYIRQTDGDVIGFQPGDAGDRAFRQLRKKFKEAGKPLWGRATFDLWPDGKFDMKFAYDNCDENGNTPFDAEEEHRRFEARRKRLTGG